MEINYGFDPTKVVIKPEDWKFGSNIPLTVLNEEGQWGRWLPKYEPQAEKYETWGCTIWGLQNQVEILMKFLYGFEPNFSERFNYNIVGIEEGGANPNDGYQSAKNDGLIDQHFLPVPETFIEFKAPRPMTAEFINEGKKFKYLVNHEWVVPSNPAKMKELIKETLRYCPVALSVTAWKLDPVTGLYINNEQLNNHWCVAFGWRESELGLILKVFDSYDHSIKELHPEHFVAFAKRISISRKLIETKPKQSWWTEVRNWWWIDLPIRGFKVLFNL